ncbi:MAG: thiolase family protein, partial [Myxococcota bacterium]|nr:thiolase family protein [Myxococcota bacterium]
GVDKTFQPDDPVGMMGLFAAGLDQLDPDKWGEFYASAAAESGLTWRPHPARITLLDICALQAEHHMAIHGTTREQIASSASKNHGHGALNPKAQYQSEMTVQEVLEDKPVVGPLTRAMCAPIGDGAAAAVLCSAATLSELPAEIRERAVRLSSCAMAGGTWRGLGAPSPARTAADRAYQLAGISPEDVDIVELHDATSFAELHLSEMLRLCPEGQGGNYVASGAASLGGKRPANTSGGLVSKGHPLGASGVAMVHELVTQLRGEAGARQVEGASVALQETGGGMIGFDEALTSVMVLERTEG